MRNILDPSDFSIGEPLAAPLFSPVPRPVAVPDALTVLRDNGPVTVAVLANDVDPVDGVPALAGAYAALGTAVAETDGTVTYTPLPGFTGFDTIVYTVENSLGRTDTGEVAVTVEAPTQTLSVNVTPENTLEVTAEAGVVEINVTEPPEFGGSYIFDTADLAAGPVNLVQPGVTGPFADGATVSAVPGLWVVDTGAGTLAKTYQWFRDAVPIGGATSETYTVAGADLGPGLRVNETLTDAFGARTAESALYTGIPAFTPAADTGLLGWFDAADAATITASGNSVTEWADKAGNGALAQTSPAFQPVTGQRSQNGLNMLDFGGNAFLTRSDVLSADGDVALHGVFAVDAVGNPFEALLAVDATVDFQVDAANATQFDGRLNLAGAGTSVTLTGGPFSGVFVLSVIFDRTGLGGASVYISDTLRGQTAYTTTLDAAVDLYVMTNRTQNAYIDGAVCELVLTRTLTNRAEYHTYLAAKWGVS